ncbi:type VI secretion system Vgr family protein [Caballeronia sordidicola]|jgi:type VI secretion system secreted protein VgrG|uniref:VGR-related protein n=1 Tax=Caballeronia sordidicola TaxID=196367 RepID=A0A226XBF9_CABSO|nr:type VI secretion system Vgr family protein [Caballeronia sordidicola]OXC80449.1 VGR-related protein [Caballeronia sordidicola]
MGSNPLYDMLRIGNAQYNRLIKLDTPLGVDWLLPLLVRGISRLGRDYEFIVDVVTSRGSQIELKALLARAVTLWIRQTDGSYLPFHGYVHRFSRLGSDGPLTYYQLRFSSWLHFLRLRRDMRDWQEQSGEQILSDVFDQHPQAQGAYRFDLREPLPSYSNRVQWEYDDNFVHRSMEETGVFPRFEQAKDGKSHTLVVMDDLYFAPALDQQTVPFSHAGTNDETAGLSQWKEQQSVESAQLTTRTSDYKRPDLPKEISGSTKNQSDLPAQGEVYDYTGAYTWSAREQGEQRVITRTEEWESRAKRFYGTGSLRCAIPGRWFELTGHPVHDSGSQQDREFAIIEVKWTIQNNIQGADGSTDFPQSLSAEVEQIRSTQTRAGEAVRHPDGSEGFFLVEIEAQRRRVPFRSPFEHHKPVMQLQSGTIAGPGSEEIYTDELNRVKVLFAWNRRNDGDERASCWVRSAFPDAGSQRGGTFPLRKGDEVIVGFMEGDCDRPVILSRMHGGSTQPVWNTNGLLSGHRSKEYGGSGYNQIVMDDSTGQSRVHLYSTSSESHLHLGYLIQHTDNTRGAYLGSGFDLKSNAYGAIRAGQGLVVSTYPASVNQPLNVSQASGQLVSAETLVERMSEASVANQAETLQPGQDALKKFTDATQYGVSGSNGSSGRTAGGGTGSANGFSTPIMLMASPAGMALSTQQSAQITADQHVNIVSGQSTHVAAGKSLIVSVTEKISMFVQNAGMKLFAAKGKVEIQAKSDEMALTALKDLTITSVNGRLVLSAEKEVWIGAGGSYIKIGPNLIENGTAGQILEKCASWDKPGAASMRLPTPLTSVAKGCAWRSAAASADSASSIALD